MSYLRPLIQNGASRPSDAQALLGRDDLWFTHVEMRERQDKATIVPASDLREAALRPFLTPRVPIAGLDLSLPRVMGILNVTPDSFSDGGRHDALPDAVNTALAMQNTGADIVDVGGESTRPGAAFIQPEEEIRRTEPVIAAFRAQSTLPVSIDTRKAAVAEAALNAGASLVNDVAGFTFDPDLAGVCVAAKVPVCVMHAQGDPKTMQENPHYDDVVLDVYDFLKARITYLENLGLPRDQIIVDPGIGFGKTLEHNLMLLKQISIFHGLGCPILLGASRKRFIGTIGEEPQADARMPGSLAVGLAAVNQGVQILRVHDVAETRQALRLWQAVQ